MVLRRGQGAGAVRDTIDDRVDPGLRRTAVGSTYSASDYLDAVAVRMRLGQLMGQFHQTYDVLVTPTLPLPAFAAGQDVPEGWTSPDWTSWTPYTYPFNLTQQPALSVPCGSTSAGLPRLRCGSTAPTEPGMPSRPATIRAG